MPSYSVQIFTGNRLLAHTFNNVYIKLVGEDGESKRTWAKGPFGFFHGSESTISLSCHESLGKLLMIELDKQQLPLFPEDSWFVDKVEVTSPEGQVYKFPIYQWIEDEHTHHYMEETGSTVQKMASYSVQIFTGNRPLAHTFNNVYIKLVGEDGESQRTWAKGPFGFFHGSKSTFHLSCHESLGKLLMIELDKQQLPLFAEDSWFVDKVEVTSPEGQVYKFPIYQWIEDEDTHYYMEGTATLAFEEQKPVVKGARELELQRRKEEYSWEVYEEGMPHCMNTEDDLPSEVRFSYSKTIEFTRTNVQGLAEMKLTGLANCVEPWPDFDSIHRVFHWHKNETSEYVYEHWRDDAFFGSQYLSGLNPILIRRCTALPQHFPVTDEMVQLDLNEEMKKGNMFLCDYKLLDGVKTNVINDEDQFLTAPLVLLHKTPMDELKPVAIQLKQKPASDNPIFLPSDHEYDWLLAKTFVRSAEFNDHELNVHLLRTHLLAEVFAVALLRNIPRVHPLYKLLLPHTRYTFAINSLARKQLISEEGVLTKYAASGGEGMITILQRALSSLTYRSLCLPEDIKDRGVESVPKYYYRDDGLQLWDIIHRFVNGILTNYYKSDSDVQKDTELQNYIKDVFEHGFLSRTESGIPQSFSAVDELVKFVTMVMFTCSAQHSAVNSGQLDIGNWMPNFPPSLQHAPPTVKGRANEHIFLQTLPDVNTTVNILAILWLLSEQYNDFYPLGWYPEELFCEEVPRDLIKKFEGELKDLGADIGKRNTNLDLPYKYLELIENSVAI